MLLHLFGQQISLSRKLRGREQPVPRKPVEKTCGFWTAVIPAQQMNNRAFGPRELMGQESDGVEDEDQFGHRRQRVAGCESVPVGRYREE